MKTLRSRKTLFFCVAVSMLSLILTGCGGAGGGVGTTPIAPAPPPAGIQADDNWQLVPWAGSRQMGAVFHVTIDNRVAGFIHVSENGQLNCYNEAQNNPLSGVVSSGLLFAQAKMSDGADLTVSLPNDPRNADSIAGSYIFENGCANEEQGPITATKFQPVTGSFSGTLFSAPFQSSTTVTANLTQGTSADSDGFLNLTGTVTYDTHGCSKQFSVESSISRLSGSYIQLNLLASDGTTTAVYGRVNSTATQLSLADVDGTCGYGGVGTLTRQ